MLETNLLLPILTPIVKGVIEGIRSEQRCNREIGSVRHGNDLAYIDVQFQCGEPPEHRIDEYLVEPFQINSFSLNFWMKTHWVTRKRIDRGVVHYPEVLVGHAKCHLCGTIVDPDHFEEKSGFLEKYNICRESGERVNFPQEQKIKTELRRHILKKIETAIKG